MVLVEHVAEFDFDVRWEPLLHHGGDFAAPLPMAISHSEEMAILQATEVWHSDPRILILFVGIGRRLTGFSGKCKFSDAVGVHLLGVRRVVRMLKVGHLTLG